MNFSGKHFEFAGTSSKDPLGDGSVSLIFAHIDTEMFKQPFGYPEYSSVYSGRLGRRGLTGTKRNDSCLEIETEIVSEKSGIPLASLRVVEQWLFSREAFAKLYIAEDEEDEEDVQYINGEKKRLYLNCMLTEPEILTYAEGKVGWKVKVICDAPWAWQDEHTQTIYMGATGWYQPIPLGTEITSTGSYYRRPSNTFVEASTLNISGVLPNYMEVEYDGTIYSGDEAVYVPPQDIFTLRINVKEVSMGPYGYIEIDGVQVARKDYDGSSSPLLNYLIYEFVVPEGRMCVVRSVSCEVATGVYAHGLSVVTTEQMYEFVSSSGSSLPTIYVDSDINDYLYPDRVVLANESDYYSVDLPDNLPSSVGFWDSQERHGASDDFTIPITDYITCEIDPGYSWWELRVNGTTIIPRTVVDPEYGSLQQDIHITEDVIVTLSSYQWDSGAGLIPVTVINVANTASRPFSLTNVTDSTTRKTEFSAWASSNTIIVNNNGTIEDGAGNNLLPYMTQRNFPRLLSQYNNRQIGLVGANRFSIEGDITSAAFTFKNRRFLS